MKNIFSMFFLFATITLSSQNLLNVKTKNTSVKPDSLQIIFVNKDVSTHFLALEPISYVDLSTKDIVGDIPLDNTLRVKPIKEGGNAVLTIVTERYISQYLLAYTDDLSKVCTRYTISYADVKSFMNPEANMTKSQMYDYSQKMFVSNQKYYNVSTTKSMMKLILNNIYTLDKYFFFDLSMINKSKIQYDIDQIRFKISDKKQVKATNSQDVEVLPLMQLLEKNTFKKVYRNVFVFDKFTFPDEKVLTVEISEKQISGRTIILKIDYSDVLNADSFLN